VRQGEQVPPRRRACESGALGRLRGVQALAFGVETLEHGQALGHALDEVGLGDGRFGHGVTLQEVRDDRTKCALIAQCPSVVIVADARAP
jgi:hypothetical protein